MSNLTEWIKEELYPNLFDVIDEAFPELNFKMAYGDWRSPFKLDSSEPKTKRADKTVITKKAPGVILEQGGEALSLIDYTMRYKGLEMIEAVKFLASKANVVLPGNDNFDPESYRTYKQQQSILETASNYFVWCMHNSPSAKTVLAYLSGRGYSQEETEKMELGFIPSQEQIIDYLVSKDFSKEQVLEVLKISHDSRIGSTHRLTIPYRSGGTIKGFKFRSLDPNAKGGDKYLNSKGLDKIGGFFNISPLKGNKDLIIVEGELDALSATVKGLDNVVATGGASINPEQVTDAIKKGAKKVTLCLDTEQDPASTDRAILRALEVLKQFEDIKLFVASLPSADGVKCDPDSFIKVSGIDAFRSIIGSAQAYSKYYLHSLIRKYYAIQQANGGELADKHLSDLIDEAVLISRGIPSRIDRDLFLNEFLRFPTIKELGITEDSLKSIEEALRYKEDKELQDKELKKLLDQANTLTAAGETEKALGLLNTKAKTLAAIDKGAIFENLLNPVSEEEIKTRLANAPDSLKTSYRLGDDLLEIPSGAITIVAAPTSHGKTTALINFGLDVIRNNQLDRIDIFSYEEDKDSILIKALNTAIGEPLSANNRKSIKSYFKENTVKYFGQNADKFLQKKKEFFDLLITPQRLNIHYVSYSSDLLCEGIRYLRKHTNTKAIFIDYMQLLHKGSQGQNKYSNRQEELKQICLDLKDAAVETGLPIILGAQFNRTVVNHLLLHSTRIGEAGDIERIANVLLGLWNNNFEPVGTDAEKKEIYDRGIDKRDTIFCKVLKNRDASVGAEGLFNYDGNTGSIKTQDTSYNEF